MKQTFIVLKEIFVSRILILRMTMFELKSDYKGYYLGVVWKFLSPAFQVLAFWFVFGFGFRQNQPVGDIPFIIWLLCGIIPWFFISSSILEGSNSVFRRISLVSKMNFPISVLPVIVILKNLSSFIILNLLLFLILLLNGFYPTIYTVQFLYFLLCMLSFVFALALFNSTINVIIRDYQQLLIAGMRMVFFFSPIFWNPGNMPELFQNILRLNPIYYIISGFRSALVLNQWGIDAKHMTSDISYSIYFWSITLFLLVVGSILHLKFRDRFADLV